MAVASASAGAQWRSAEVAKGNGVDDGMLCDSLRLETLR